MNTRFGFIGKQLGIVLLVIAGTFLGIFALFKLSIFLAPFVIAFLLASLMEPLIKLLTKKARLKRKPSAVISLLLLLSSLGLIVTLIVMKITDEAKSLYGSLPQYYDTIYKNVNDILGRARAFYIRLPDEITGNLGNSLNDVSTFFMDMINALAKNAILTAITLPQILVFILVTILSTYFFASDRELISKYVNTQLPTSFIAKAREIKNEMFSALFGYVRAQLIIMTVTFTELSIGFTVIGIGQPILIALLISLVDALPILGTGGILIPWAIYAAITGQLRLAISIFVIYVIVLVVRQMIEPKILGQQIGVHPLLTLLAMYSGLKLLGVPGLIFGPVSLILVINILKGIYKDKNLKDILTMK